MGFTTGFTGGVTLTLGIAYLTVLAHERNRQAQATALRSHSRVLNSIIEPTPLPPPRTRAELAREERSSLVETAKDRWNDEVENAVRWVQRTDWSEVREGMEGAVARLLGGGLQKSRDGIEEVEKQAGPRVQEAVDRSKAAARKGLDNAAEGVDKAVAATISGVERAGTEVKEGASRIASSAKANAEKASSQAKEQLGNAEVKTAELRDVAKVKKNRAVAETKTGAESVAESVRNSGGTVNAARGAVRDVISKGIEKGREVVGKAQAAVGLAAAGVDSKSQSALGSNPVEKALNERYEKRVGLDQSVEEALAERYKPIEARDNTHLRGL